MRFTGRPPASRRDLPTELTLLLLLVMVAIGFFVYGHEIERNQEAMAKMHAAECAEQPGALP